MSFHPISRVPPVGLATKLIMVSVNIGDGRRRRRLSSRRDIHPSGRGEGVGRSLQRATSVRSYARPRSMIGRIHSCGWVDRAAYLRARAPSGVESERWLEVLEHGEVSDVEVASVSPFTSAVAAMT